MLRVLEAEAKVDEAVDVAKEAQSLYSEFRPYCERCSAWHGNSRIDMLGLYPAALKSALRRQGTGTNVARPKRCALPGGPGCNGRAQMRSRSS